MRPLTGCRRRSRLNTLNLVGLLGHYAADFIRTLKVQPELLSCPEEARQADGGIGADATALKHDVVHARRRNIKPLCQLVSGNAERSEKLFPQNFARVNSPLRCAFPLNVFVSH